MKCLVIIISAILISIIWIPKSIGDKITYAIKTYTTAVPITEKWKEYKTNADKKLNFGIFYLLYLITMTVTLAAQYYYYLIKYIIAVLLDKEDSFLA